LSELNHCQIVLQTKRNLIRTTTTINDKQRKSRRRTTELQGGDLDIPWARNTRFLTGERQVPPAWEKREREEVRWFCSIRARSAFLGHN
jgi:hypothetical protein